nr:hypothetical protein [Tanacetum cinerariifolium]
MKKDKVKKDIEEIETINIELDHKVSKLIAENEHLKQTYKQLYDSIKSTREKDLVITDLKSDLRNLKRKDLVDDDVTLHTIAPETLKVDGEPIAPKLLNNRTVHSNYLRYTQEQATILREVVEQGKSQNPLNNSLDHAFSNKPALSFTRVKPSPSASGSQPSGNTKKDKIQRAPSSTQKNKVEAHLRTFKSSLKDKNCTVEPKGTAILQHSKLNVNSEPICIKCNGCMLSDNHVLCVPIVINDINARAKSKSTFTIVGNACLLTRITTSTEVPSSRADPTLLNDFEMATEGNGDPPVPDLQTMKELCQPSLNGRGGLITLIAIQAMNFGLKNDMIQQVQNSCQFYGLPGDDAYMHLDKFLHVTQSIKVNGVTDDALCLYLFPQSLTQHATAWFDRLLRNSINTFDQMAKIFLRKYFPPSMVTKLRNKITNFRQRPDESLFKAWKCYKLSIDRCPNHNMLHVTQIDTFYNGLTLRHRDTINVAAAQWSESSSSITSFSDLEIVALKAEMTEINKNLMRVLRVNQQVKAVTPNCETCDGPHSYNDCPATVGQTQNVYAAGANQGGNSYQPQGNRNNQERNQFFQGAGHSQNPPPAYQAPGYQAPVHQPLIPQPQVMTTAEFTNYMKANDVILKNMQTNMTSLTNSNLELKNMFGQFIKMNTALSSGSGTLPSNTITNPKEDLKGITTRSGNAYQGPTIPPTSSSPPKVIERETEPVVAPIIELVVAPVSAPKPNQKPSIPFADALILMLKFGPTIKTLLTNKDKLYELARTLLNEYCLAVLLKKLPKKLGDPSKFLILCDFPRMDECLALADLDASINLMSLSVWNKLSLLELSPTCMTLELADRLISHPVGVAEDVFVKTGRALIDVFEGELTLRVGKEAITFSLDQTLRYSANYNDKTANQIDIIDMACEEYSQEVLGFSNVIASGNPTPYYDPIVSTSSLTLTPFGDSYFLLEEVDTFLALEDDPTSPEVDHSYFDTEGDTILLEAFLNDDPSPPPPTQGKYSPQVQKELKICEAKNDKSSIDEPPEVELKDLPSHLEYAFLEGDDKLPIIIAKDLSVEEKSDLIKVLKSHKQAIAWKLFDIKGIYSEFCTHKILIEDDFKPAVQHQRRINLKIHDVIKKGVLKLLDAGLIYHISDSPWVSLVHCVPKKGGFTIVENEENELIPTRLVTRWRITPPSKYLFAKKDSKARLLRWVLLLQEFKFKVIDTKGAENLAADHLSRLENPHPNVLDPKEIKETFLLEILNMVSFRGNSSTPRFADFANYHARNFVVKGMSSQKPLTFSRLAKMDPLGDIMARTTRQKGKISQRDEMPQNSIQVYEIFDVEAKALPTNDARVVCKFLKSLFARFETPRAIISDRGMHFCNDQFAKVMLKYGVTHRLANTYHPQTSGQVEVSNRGLKRILERTVGDNHASWLDKLDDALWAFRTAFKTPIGCTPYKFVYGMACHLPIELKHKAYWALKHANFHLQNEFLDFLKTCAKGFVLQSSLPQLHLGIIYPNLID